MDWSHHIVLPWDCTGWRKEVGCWGLPHFVRLPGGVVASSMSEFWQAVTWNTDLCLRQLRPTCPLACS